MSKNLIRVGARALIVFLAGALAATTLPLQAQPGKASTPRAEPLVVGFVYVTPVGDAGWTYQHDLGRRALERSLGARVKTLAVESVPEGADAERVMRDLVGQGAKLVVATSFGYLEPALRVAADHPEVRFEHAGGYKTAPNLGTYDARYYEARWLGGYLAGRISRSGIAGYVAAFPVPEVVQGINAFALGMRAANPRAQVRVIWLDTWFDPAKERAAAQTLVDRGADVLTNHSASPAVAQAAQANFAERRVRLVGYTSDMRAFAPDAQAAAIVHQWGGFYTQVATDVLERRWKPAPVWGGIASGMVDLTAVDPRLPADVRNDVAARRRAIAGGAFKPFAAPLVDNTGQRRLMSGTLDDAAIRTMDWLVEGVVGQVPRR
ncbi:BMP family ABC transporter substrate-binding protein [Piscinibacter koreensis]|uniref:BMP family ABC transporter substrate-binding protein n=1 Tax=Piscinibacter koreensis TaxID=2742824 RepID=A0A7Y6NPL5_9BURK|nr:BMP family ABC transporter substrate-binding protein [Schlegelella koreensis]NUZ06884.1 BMP family ABC transporter substrate-binding protein [Schlegelella koreensis]